jgi:hypothetical protein
MGQGIDNSDGLEQLLKEAVKNIRIDRSTTNVLLSDLINEMKQPATDNTHQDLGLIAAKYVETLQRSNEQLVKISAILNKQNNSPSSISLSDQDKDTLFDLIQENK